MTITLIVTGPPLVGKGGLSLFRFIGWVAFISSCVSFLFNYANAFQEEDCIERTSSALAGLYFLVLAMWIWRVLSA